MERNESHVLLVTFPGQGHINPSLQFARSLAKLGVIVTYCTSLSAFNRISNLPTIDGLTYAPYSDGYDGNFKDSFDEFHLFYSSVMTRGSEFVTNMISEQAEKNCPFTRIIYTTLMAWVGSVAKTTNVPSTLFWIQPATVWDIYYYYFTGYEDSFKKISKHQILELPGMPPLSPHDFPSFVSSDDNSNDWAVQSLKLHFDLVVNSNEENPRILVNTFDALESDALKAITNVTMVGIGPFISPADSSFRVDLRPISKGYNDWLDSQPNESVIYIAFGSYAQIPNQLMDEIAQGLLICGRPFLWVIRVSPNGEKPEEKLSCKLEELEKHGKIVPWCSQVEVLQHPSLGCFLTHCGWNSTLESLAYGAPTVACPIYSDQCCNAKLIQDVWKTGVRANANEEGIVTRDELKRCIDIVMEGEDFRKNATKWRDLAKEAMKENGSSNVNLKAYIEEILLGHS